MCVHSNQISFGFFSNLYIKGCVLDCVWECVCVFVCERERERESVCVCVCVSGGEKAHAQVLWLAVWIHICSQVYVRDGFYASCIKDNDSVDTAVRACAQNQLLAHAYKSRSDDDDKNTQVHLTEVFNGLHSTILQHPVLFLLRPRLTTIHPPKLFRGVHRFVVLEKVWKIRWREWLKNGDVVWAWLTLRGLFCDVSQQGQSEQLSDSRTDGRTDGRTGRVNVPLGSGGNTFFPP